jgi:hypothetical protein
MRKLIPFLLVLLLSVFTIKPVMALEESWRSFGMSYVISDYQAINMLMYPTDKYPLKSFKLEWDGGGLIDIDNPVHTPKEPDETSTEVKLVSNFRVEKQANSIEYFLEESIPEGITINALFDKSTKWYCLSFEFAGLDMYDHSFSFNREEYDQKQLGYNNYDAQEVLEDGLDYYDDYVYKAAQTLVNKGYVVIDSPSHRTVVSPTESVIVIGDEQFRLNTYNVDGNNHLKLRDLAFILNGTGAQFDVNWDGKNIIIAPKQAYTEVGGELVLSESRSSKTLSPSTQSIVYNDEEPNIKGYSVDGNNYYKLRDIAVLLNFKVDWDGAIGAIKIDPDSPYDGI